jgi:hypothetical protein
LFIAGAQAWLCLRRWPEMNRDDNWQFPDHAVKTLLRASELLSADKDAESALALGLGKVLRKIVKRDYQNTKGVFKQFAKIDEIRVPFFESF